MNELDIERMRTMSFTIESVQKYLESLGYYKEVVLLEEQKGDCMYFEAINHQGIDVTIRADVEDEVTMDRWNFYECSEEYDWEQLYFLYG